MTQPYPSKQQFSIEVAPIPTAASSIRATLRVEHVRVSRAYDELTFVYRTGDSTYQTDYYSTFVAEPSDLLTAATIEALSARHGFIAVVGPGSPVEANLWLDTNITELYGDYRESGKPIARIRARFMLLKETATTTSVVAEWTIQGTEPIASGGPEQLAASWGRAYGTILADLAPQLETACAAHLPEASK